MVVRSGLLALVIAGCIPVGLLAESVATAAGTDKQVPCRRENAVLLLEAHAAARAFGWEAKVVEADKLLIVCRGEAKDICVPIQLDRVRHLSGGEGLFVEAAALGQAMRFAVDDRSGRIVLRRGTTGSANEQVAAYDAHWGPGRGFEIGRTLPDIPLYDMQGREVRFSRFLGKQYILYCWASW